VLELKALLSEVGPRRALLAARLGSAAAPLSDAALLARFRAAGLEREFALRERDLIRGLWSRHRASEVRVSTELSTTPAELRRVPLADENRNIVDIDGGFTELADQHREHRPAPFFISHSAKLYRINASKKVNSGSRYRRV